MIMTSRGSISLTRLFAAAATLALGWLVTPAVAQNAYITNFGDGTVSVIDTTKDTVVATVPVGNNPFGCGRIAERHHEVLRQLATQVIRAAATRQNPVSDYLTRTSPGSLAMFTAILRASRAPYFFGAMYSRSISLAV